MYSRIRLLSKHQSTNTWRLQIYDSCSLRTQPKEEFETYKLQRKHTSSPDVFNEWHAKDYNTSTPRNLQSKCAQQLLMKYSKATSAIKKWWDDQEIVTKPANCKAKMKEMPKEFSFKKYTFATATVATTATVTASDPSPATDTSENVDIDEIIPDAPPSPSGAAKAISDDYFSDALNLVNIHGEPTFKALGLGSNYTPIGWMQQYFEYLTTTCDIPWWQAIVITTVIIRTLLMPLVVITQRNAAKLNNNLPEMQRIQGLLMEARKSGDKLQTNRWSQELQFFMMEKGCSPIKNIITPIVQAPIFITLFMSLRNMATVPVEGLRTGGLLWFTDLTIPDQFYLLPIGTSLTLLIAFEVGTDTSKLKTQSTVFMRYAMRIAPFVMFPAMVNFPGALLLYWFSTNLVSLLQVCILRIPTVRRWCKIQHMLAHKKSELPLSRKTFRQGLSDAWTNVIGNKATGDQGKMDEIEFNKAGKGPLIKTYKYDPSKTRFLTEMRHK